MLLTACGRTVPAPVAAGSASEEQVVHVQYFALDRNLLRLEKVGDSEQLTFTLRPDDATDQTVYWESSDESVATVDDDGLVTAVGEGQATVTATVDGKTSNCTVACALPAPDASGTAEQPPEEEPTETQQPTPPKATSASGVEWKTVSYTKEDADGYTFEITYKVSPWMLLSANRELLESTWKTVNRHDDPLPGFDDWHLSKGSNSSYYKSYESHASASGTGASFTRKMTDMYYCIGTVTYKNVTDGWNVTKENPRSMPSSLIWWYDLKVTIDFSNGGIDGDGFGIGRIYYSNKSVDKIDGVRAEPSIESNTWGPASFIIMAPENFTPNCPEGQCYEAMKKGVFNRYAEELLRIGVIGKDGVYVPPAED